MPFTNLMGVQIVERDKGRGDGGVVCRGGWEMACFGLVGLASHVPVPVDYCENKLFLSAVSVLE
jgi:hypothetical protein